MHKFITAICPCRIQSAGHTRNCTNLRGNCSASLWKKRQRLSYSNDCAGQPIRPRNWRGPLPIHYSSIRLCLTRSVRERFQQEQISDAQSSLTSLDADLRFEGIHSVSRMSDPISTGGGEM